MAGSKDGSTGLIVVGIDGSDSSTAALRWACEEAARSGATVEALTSWHWPMSLGAAIPIPDGYDPAADAGKVLEKSIAPLVAEFAAVTVRPVVAEGHAADVLVEASRRADLLVVGSRGHGELSGMLIGSVSQHCAAHAAAPVLIYRHPHAGH
ncbi:MAG TPA: universal stress protein [Acidimicrobiales bacterium]|jgi:nucleotide-binding universal stress UspA family protein|nr:universal stress protein [Acidimicrobiales bacterium]